MSCTEIYAVPPEGGVYEIAEIQNSFRGAMFVWNSLSERYFPGKMILMDMKPVWDLAKGDLAEEFEKIVLGSTFDNVICEKDRIDDLCNAFRKFADRHGEGSLLEQVDVLQSVKNDEIIGVCWNQTSVNCDTWRVCDGDEDDPQERMFDISIDKDYGNWFLFEDGETEETK